MDDLISRQAAIDALHMHLMYRMGTDSNKKRLDEWINNLPSAQLDVPDMNDGDIISRQAAIETAKKMYVACNTNSIDDYEMLMEEALKVLPSAEPQIIRCKDCKHWIPYDWMFREVWQSKNIADYPEDEIGCALNDMAMKADDFCSRAERRTE